MAFDFKKEYKEFYMPKNKPSIYEVKYSKEQVSGQYRHLNDDEKCSMTSHRYGDIAGKYVIYRGEPAKCGDIQYLNVEDYLKSLK